LGKLVIRGVKRRKYWGKNSKTRAAKSLAKENYQNQTKK
jgi:hypothetical protein